jgi:hypothetical protein
MERFSALLLKTLHAVLSNPSLAILRNLSTKDSDSCNVLPCGLLRGLDDAVCYKQEGRWFEFL